MRNKLYKEMRRRSAETTGLFPGEGTPPPQDPQTGRTGPGGSEPPGSGFVAQTMKNMMKCDFSVSYREEGSV